MAERLKDLSKKQKQAVVEDYLGIHPDYLWFKENTIEVDLYKLAADKKIFSGFKPGMNDGK